MKFILPLILLLLPQVLPGGNAKKQGREGNTLYKQDQYEQAADAYYGGLASYQEETQPDEAYYGLQNNLGAALHRQEDYDMAQAAFAKAMETAPTNADYARAAYNAGNNAFQRKEAEAALEDYKKALLADPANQDAKFNYEFVKRQLEEQQNQDQNQDQQQDQNQDENQEQNQDQQQQNQDPDQNQDQQQDQQEQQQAQQDQQQDQQEQQQEQQQQPDQQLSRQQAERILQALENEEEQLLREVQKMKGRPRRVEKDW